MSGMSLDHLFDDVEIGSLAVPNRIVMPSMTTRFASEDGYVTERGLKYYQERAIGGTGLLIFESTYPCERHPHRHLLVDDTYIEGLSSVVDAVHTEGSKLAIQLNVHRGTADKVDPLAPSRVTTPDGREISAIDQVRIEELVESFRSGVERAKRAGFDGIEIHAASGYLVHQFLSPRTNDRSDEYGGSIDGQTRFARELLQAARDVLPSDTPVWFRIAGNEFLNGGYGVDRAKTISQRLERAGSDAFHVTGGHNWNYQHIVLSGAEERGVYANLASAVKTATTVPVIAVGRINDPVTANNLIDDGKADLIAMGRAHLADPHIARKAKAGEFGRIRICVGGLEGCRDRIDETGVVCTVNPQLGREGRISDRKVDDPVSVVVIGGGPAGMEAARVAATRGHDVELFERGDRLGGQLRWARHAPAKSEYGPLLTYYEAELDDADVEVSLGVEVEAADLADIEADQVILATGSSPEIPKIGGITAAIDAAIVVSPKSVLAGGTPQNYRHAVVLGGTEIGTDVAEFLSNHGVGVTILAEGTLLPKRLTEPDKPLTPRTAIIDRLEDNSNIEWYEESTPIEFQSDTVEFFAGDQRQQVQFDRVVLAERTPARLVDVGAAEGVTRIGDADRPADLFTAIHDGARAARSI